MLTREQAEQFESEGITVVRHFLAEDRLRSLAQAIDSLAPANSHMPGRRWDLRNCVAHHPYFVDFMANRRMLEIVIELLGVNTKLLGSHIVRMTGRAPDAVLAIDWHRDGGVLSAELPEPLPPAFIKIGFCVTGSSQPGGGELLIIPSSHRQSGIPEEISALSFSRVLLAPGDVVVLDWRTWHAVSSNSSEVVRRTLYYTYGFRWLTPIDYHAMPQKLVDQSPLHRQLLGGATQLGAYLPSESELPLREIVSAAEIARSRRHVKRTRSQPGSEPTVGRKCQGGSVGSGRPKTVDTMIAQAIRNKTT